METDSPELIKHREIHFVALHPDPQQAETAALMLTDVEGILQLHPATETLLHISYHLLAVSLQQIEEALTGAGLHLDNRLLYRLKRALYYFTEENQRANHGCLHGDTNCTKQIFVHRYARLDHSCRDHRPEHWRKYL